MESKPSLSLSTSNLHLTACPVALENENVLVPIRTDDDFSSLMKGLWRHIRQSPLRVCNCQKVKNPCPRGFEMNKVTQPLGFQTTDCCVKKKKLSLQAVELSILLHSIPLST